MKQKGLLLILAVTITFLGYSQESEGNSFTLQQAQNYALEHSYKAQISEKDLEIAIKQMRIITAIGLPQINGEVKFQNFLDIPTTLIPAVVFNPMAPEGEFLAAQFGTEYNTNASLSASQLLFDGSYFVGLKAAKTFVEFSKLGLDKTTANIKETVAGVYYDLLTIDRQKQLIDANIAGAVQQKKEIDAMVAEGFGEQTDSERLELVLLSLENSKTKVIRAEEVLIGLLKAVIGMDTSETLSITEKLDDVIGALDYEKLSGENTNVASHIDLQQLRMNKDLMKLNMKKEQMSLLPQLSAFISHQQSSMGNELKFDTWYPTTVWGLTARVPIFSGGSKMYRIQEAKLGYEKANLQMLEVEQMLKQNNLVASSNFKTAYESYLIAQKMLNLSEKIKKDTYTKFTEGLASSFEFTQAQDAVLSAQNNYITTLAQLLDAKVQLDKAFNNL